MTQVAVYCRQSDTGGAGAESLSLESHWKAEDETVMPTKPTATGHEVTSEVAQPEFDPNVVRGVYANQLQEMSSAVDTFLDFRLSFPAQYQYTEEGRLADVRSSNALVARLIVPKLVFQTFVTAYVRNTPDVLAAVMGTTREDEA